MKVLLRRLLKLPAADLKLTYTTPKVSHMLTGTAASQLVFSCTADNHQGAESIFKAVLQSQCPNV